MTKDRAHYGIKNWYACCLCWALSACGGGSSGGSTPTTFSEPTTLPQLLTSPVNRIDIGTDFRRFILGTQPIEFNTSTNASQQYSQLFYKVNDDGVISALPMLDQAGLPLDLTGNIAFTSEANIIPLDLMSLNSEYVLMAIRYRDLDGNHDNDYINQLIHLRTGFVVSAPVGLNKGGNSGRTALSELGRDYFPPDDRWNDTEDLYIIDVDYDLVDVPTVDDEDHREPVDHYNDPPPPICPEPAEETDEPTSESEPNTDGEDANDAPTSESTDEPSGQTNCIPASEAPTSEEEATTTTAVVSQAVIAAAEPTSTQFRATQFNAHQPLTLMRTVPHTFQSARDEQTFFPPLLQKGTGARSFRSATIEEIPPTPTAVYRMVISGTGGMSLEKVSAPDDRPGLGQFIASRSGILIYRNMDGGDNSYRVILSGCDEVTGRLTTVLHLRNSTLIVDDDESGNSTVFELTERGVNRLIFNCNGEIIREAYSGYSTRIRPMRMAFNDVSIAPYHYQAPYFITDTCQGGRLQPRQDPEIAIYNPLPSIPGLPSADVRSLRKSQILNSRLYCIGYDEGLDLTVMALDPTVNSEQFFNLNMPFEDWLPDFDTLSMISNNEITFTGYRRTNSTRRSIRLNTDGEEEDITDELGGFEVLQQIDAIHPDAVIAEDATAE